MVFFGVLTLYCLTVDLTHAYVLDEIGLFLTLAIHKIKRDEMVYWFQTLQVTQCGHIEMIC